MIKAALAALIITYNAGGNIADTMLIVGKAAREHRTVIIDGYCASACTLHLSNPRTCVTPRAVLVFHAASNALGTAYLMRMYPANIREYIQSQGGLTKRLIILRGKLAQRLIGSCRGVIA